MTVATVDKRSMKILFHVELDVAVEYAEQHDLIVVSQTSDLDGWTKPLLLKLHNAIAVEMNQPKKRKLPTVAKTAQVMLLEELRSLWAFRHKQDTFGQTQKGGISLSPSKEAKPCRLGTKQSILVDMLARPEGATMTELHKALKPWQMTTVRSGIYWDVNKLKGYGIETTFNGEPRYHLVYPKGMSAPLPHTPAQSK